ncbi:MAG: hypothetical protein JW751_03400 [Polyangiaceae bacterium]|nr:hypothetical protein [Polyangiaceae bacterium]
MGWSGFTSLPPRAGAVSDAWRYWRRQTHIDFETTDRFYADAKDATKVTRCRCTTPMDGFRDVGDRRMPTRGKAVWHPPEGELAYADFTLDPTTVAFNVAPGV